ncbi:MAG: hypothetical protein R2911_38465 [Caldilineaceae bacterium]
MPKQIARTIDAQGMTLADAALTETDEKGSKNKGLQTLYYYKLAC